MRSVCRQTTWWRVTGASALALALLASTLGAVKAPASDRDVASAVARAALAPDLPKRPSDPSAFPAPTAYQGLGTWVDIYDGAVFDAPEDSVRAMAERGVKTIYVETANSGYKSAICRPADMRRLIRAAHARRMRVVAWYLPTLRSPYRDYYRCKEAIRFRTYDGQRFDSFALDIESSAVTPASLRNKRLIWLSKKIRAVAGRRYPLGAIIPSPAGMQRQPKYWTPFPYASLAGIYDVILPMTYYTYRWDGAQAVYDSMSANMTLLRSQEGYEHIPVHLIGGLASRSSAAEVEAFVTAAREGACAGASLYDWTTTSAPLWPELAAVTDWSVP